MAFVVATVDLVARPLLSRFVAVMVEAVADVALRLAGEGGFRTSGNCPSHEDERQGEDAGHRHLHRIARAW